MSIKNLSIDEIISRMCLAAKVDNPTSLAKFMGYSSTGTVSGWKKSGEVPPSALKKLSDLVGKSIDEIILGEGLAKGFDFIQVPRYNVQASAGGGSLVESEQIVDHLAFRAEWVRNTLGVSPKDLAVVSVIGESMEPYLADGDLILIDTKINRFVGDAIYVLANDGVLQVKRLQLAADGSLMMKSENPCYGDILYREEAMNGLRIIGKLVRRLVR